MVTARPESEWSEDDGNVLWWRFPVEEPPYVGTPNDTGMPTTVRTYGPTGEMLAEHITYIGGWPGYHTHWTPIPMATLPPALTEETGR